jgi:Holliday junction resolvase
MNNHSNGLEFESRLKKVLKDRGMKVLSLSYTETADLIILNNPNIVIECKISHKATWYRKNPKQYDKLIVLNSGWTRVYVAIKFVIGHKSTIEFFDIRQDYPFRKGKGMGLDEFINYIKD